MIPENNQPSISLQEPSLFQQDQIYNNQKLFNAPVIESLSSNNSDIGRGSDQSSFLYYTKPPVIGSSNFLCCRSSDFYSNPTCILESNKAKIRSQPDYRSFQEVHRCHPLCRNSYAICGNCFALSYPSRDRDVKSIS
jgi:hypothetical protein